MRKEKEYWIANISNRNVSLADLNITIKAYSSVNLMSNHYKLTEDQITNSVICGSIYAKSNKIHVRKVAPIKEYAATYQLEGDWIPDRSKSNHVIEYQEYEELKMSDEEFAESNADIVDANFGPKKE